MILLDSNQFSGPVPKNFGNLRNLTDLNLASNLLSGMVPDLSNATQLNYLNLSNNNFTSSPAPGWFATLMDNDGLTGTIPSALSLANNGLNGADPVDDGVVRELVSRDSASRAPWTGGHGTVVMQWLLLLFLLSVGLRPSFSQTNSQDVAALQALMNNWQNGPQSWTGSTDPCSSWDGISCSNGRVTEVFTGNIPSEIGNLSQLTFLALNSNKFTGGIPPTLGLLSNLNWLDMSVNQLSGQIPVSPGLNQLVQAQHLIFDNNNFTGPIPASLGQVKSLQIIRLDHNKFSGPVPDSIGNLSKLMELSLASNLLNGTLPDLTSVTQDLSNNNFASSPAPGWFSTLTSLNSIFMDNDDLTGAIPSGLFSLPSLQQVSLANNTFSGKLNMAASWGAGGTDNGEAPQLKGARYFSFEELKKSTNNFSEINEIGSGGYGKVYKGTLANGQIAAIKRAQQGSMQGAAEFKNEIELLSRVHHKNLVSLVGFCYEQGEQMLVYEYIPYGTLRENLMGKGGVSLDWKKRLRIAIGSAKGIAYLHELADPPIIHRDIKSTNILLDESLNAKVADFGLSKLVSDTQKGHVSTQVKGTLGYLDPEYYMTQQLSEKSDVYSFGVVLLELITAKQPIEKGRRLSSINLQGTLSNSIGQLSELVYLDLSSNSGLSGLLPTSIGNLKQLTTLLFDNNQLSGPIPDEIGSITTLQILNFADNQLRGTMPDLSALTKLNAIILSNNAFSGTFDMTDLTNNEHFQQLETSLWTELGLHPGSVFLSDVLFTSDNYLQVKVRMFPPTGTSFNLLEVTRIGFDLSNQAYKPPQGFGPYYFVADPYVHFAASWGIAQKDSGGAPQLKGARFFSFDELKTCTNNFAENNEIGSGGYGKVYKGILVDGTSVAIKRAEYGSKQGALEFKNEIELLSRVHHKNLYKKYNCYAARGIYLDWKKRLRITLGSARGLAYLHELANPPIIHRDVKSTNILLDDNYKAKVADFGLSKLVTDTEKGHVSTQVKGTLGYLDPEYYMTQQLSEKSDVYSFGVVMLEILSGRLPISKGRYIVREFRMAIDANDQDYYGLQGIVDPAIHDAAHTMGFRRFVQLAMECVDESASRRPTMNTVVKEIEAMLQSEGLSSGSSSTVEFERVGSASASHLYGGPVVTPRSNSSVSIAEEPDEPPHPELNHREP
nr:unnamed protein product [Digitaria exilis]